MSYQNISTKVESGIGVISLNRPDRNNSLDLDTMREMCAGLDALIADDAVKALILRGEGKHFCAGADFGFLDELARTPPTQVQSDIYAYFQGAARRIYNCPKPTVAAISGAAVTVGCELSLACDFRIISETAMFQESWIKLGLMPPLGGLFLLPRIVGLGVASQMVLRGEAIKAERAVQIGLAMAAVPVIELDQRALDLAAELAALPLFAYASVKQALQRGMSSNMEAEWTANVSRQAVLLSANDYREGLAAVREKRAGVFTGS